MRAILISLLLFVVSLSFGQKNVTHKVKRGDTFYKLANQYNTNVAAIYKLNPRLKGKSLQISQQIQIPSKKNKSNKKDKEVEIVTNVPLTHIVGRGDTFFKISKKYQLNVVDIVAYNKNLESSNLKIGDIIYLQEVGMKETNLPVATVIAVEDEAAEITHVVLSKETKYGLAKKYNTSIAELERLNPDIKAGLEVGITLIIKSLNPEANVVAATQENESDNEEYDISMPLSESNFDKANFLIDKSFNFIGTRYRSGGTSTNGFDCSGLMCTTFKEIDVNLPRTSRDQSQSGKKVKRKQAQIGDLIFFSTNGKGSINHVGMITEVNDNEIKFIHSSTSAGVIISSLNENYYSKRFKQINRVLL